MSEPAGGGPRPNRELEEGGPRREWARLSCGDAARRSPYLQVCDLPLEVEGHELELREQSVSSGFARVTTVVSIHGRGCRGFGEDVTYEAESHERYFEERSRLDLVGSHTIDSFASLLEGFLPAEAEPYARWGFEGAAFDLALRQAGMNAGEALSVKYNPVRFLVSTRLGSPPSASIIRGWLEHYPELEFKLDPQSSWTQELTEQLAATGSVRTVDLKGSYHGTPVDQPFDPHLYALVRDAFPDAYVEDPAPCPEALEILASVLDRLSWDALIHSCGDVAALGSRPGAINIKPSRFGSLERLLATIAFCREEGIPLYGGGQFELGPGREQIQTLASLFYPEGPNDVAPRAYNHGDPRAGLPRSPLEPPAAPTGLGFKNDL